MDEEHREIGGYLELETFVGEPYHRDAIALNCGRACLEYIIELRGIRTIWLPDWLCDSVSKLCARCGVEVKTYAIGFDMRPALDFEMEAGDYLYLVDYYGQLGDGDVLRCLAFSDGNLVVDESQGFFRPPWAGADTLYTCRKFFGVADGGYLYTKDGAQLARELPLSESHAHMDYLLGRYERPAGEFFRESQENNARFSAEPMAQMSPITANLLRVIDYNQVLKCRQENWDFLSSALSELNGLNLRRPYGPFMYPLLVDGDTAWIRKSLAEQGIYVPVLWPNVLDSDNQTSAAYILANKILHLPLDQRYSDSEMERIINATSALLS